MDDESVNPHRIRNAFGEFSAVVSEFCAVVDSASAADRISVVSRIYEILPRLIHQAINLPDLPCSEVDTDADLIRTRMREAEWEQLYEVLKEKLGNWNLYWQVFDPIRDSEAIRGSLADDIADIYRDVKKGVGEKNPDIALQQDAIFTWRLLYYSHWGQHAINALYTIHSLLWDGVD